MGNGHALWYGKHSPFSSASSSFATIQEESILEETLPTLILAMFAAATSSSGNGRLSGRHKGIWEVGIGIAHTCNKCLQL